MNMKRLAFAIARDRPGGFTTGGVIRHGSQGLAILHGPAPVDVPAPGLETLQAYAAMVASIHDRETILPLRFGSILESDAEIDAWLRVHAEAWRAALDEVDGCDEMGLRVLIDTPVETSVTLPEITSDRPGTSYLKALKARRDVSERVLAEASRLAGWLSEALASTFRQSLIENPGPGRERLLSLSYLVPRADRERFREGVEQLRANCPARLLLTGPWPPYSFATGRNGFASYFP
jgi:hypothetical protein